jgi:SAM-dependent methyltransferase
MDKRFSYSQEGLINTYVQKRFHGKSGEFVNQKELNTIYRFIMRHTIGELTILDSPCGTGRLGQFLKSTGIKVIGLDYSEGMLKKSKNNEKTPLVRADMFQLPVKDFSLDCMVSLRFMFHYRDIEPIFNEAKRALKNDGILIFDTFNWSPKANFLFQEKRVFIHPKRKIRNIMKNMEMKIIDESDNFFVSPMLYRLSPLYIVKLLESLEQMAPSRLFVRSFWCVQKQK